MKFFKILIVFNFIVTSCTNNNSYRVEIIGLENNFEKKVTVPIEAENDSIAYFKGFEQFIIKKEIQRRITKDLQERGLNIPYTGFIAKSYTVYFGNKRVAGNFKDKEKHFKEIIENIEK
ncbi:MAG: hypothetical protein GY739_11015 [Mesoflavibacter sp.]|nr:hypothetical protein [Mesoflavibacter sp.]